MMEESQRVEATSSVPPFSSQSRNFWRAFVERSWEHEPRAIVEGVVTPSPDDLFQTIVRCCAPARAEGWKRPAENLRSAFRQEQPPILPGRARLRFIVEGSDRLWVRKARYRNQFVVLPRCLPREADGSLEGYNARMDAMLNPTWRTAVGLPRRRYGLIINFPEHADFGLWSWAKRSFLHPLFRELGGMNNCGSYIAMFIGNYQTTPFGVHPDAESVFHVPVIGRKAMRTWESDYVKQHPDLEYALHYDKHLAASTRTEAGPGGFVYWPSRLWHVAESTSREDELSVAMAVSLLCKGERPEDRKTVPFDPDDLQSSAASFPADLRPLTPFKTPLTLSTQRERDHAWLRLVTGASFILPPHPAAPADSTPTNHARIDPTASSLAWIEREREVLVGANGSVFSTPRASLPLLEKLRAGEIVEADSTLAKELWRRRACLLLHQ